MSVAIGVDVGGTKTLGVIVDRSGTVRHEARRATPAGSDRVLDVIAEVVRELGETDRVGVGVAGLVDRRGVWRTAPNVAGIDELDVAGSLRRRLRSASSIVVDNDATCATFAEWTIGAGRGVDDLVLVTLGTGIGGGFVVGGQLQHGAHGGAGEIGHMIVDPDGPRCVCGQRGCWERFASGAGLAWFAAAARERHDLDRRYDSNEAVIAAAAADDAGAVAVVAEFARWVALGLVNLANMIDPARFVIGGGLVDAGEVLLAPVRTAFAELLYGTDHRVVPPVVAAELGSRAGAIGAGLLALA